MKIKKIEKLTPVEMYDLEMEHYPCFYANDVIVHNSNPDLIKALRSKNLHTGVYTETNQMAVNKEALANLNHPIKDTIFKRSSIATQLNNYAVKFTEKEQGFVSYNILSAATGRILSGNKGGKNKYFLNLNFQNLTKPKSIDYRAFHKTHSFYNSDTLKDIPDILDYKFLEVKKNEYIPKRDKETNEIITDSQGKPKMIVGPLIINGEEIKDSMYITEGPKQELNIRAAVTRPNKDWLFVSVDYSAEELAIAGVLSGEENFLEPYRNLTDIHEKVGKSMFKEDYSPEKRKIAKTFNFKMIYGGSVYSLVHDDGYEEQEAQELYDKYWNGLRTLNLYQSRLLREARSNPKNPDKPGTAYTYFSRPRRFLQGLFSQKFKDVKSAERKVLNHPIQGCLQKHVKILTNKGYLPIIDLYNLQEQNKLIDYKVWTGTQWATFNVVNRGECQLAQLKLADGTILDCDTRHEVLKHSMSKDSKFIKIKELNNRQQRICRNQLIPVEFENNPFENNWEFIPKPNNGHKILITKNDIKELMYWIGYWVGNGCWEPGSLRFIFGLHKLDLAEQALKFFKEKFGIIGKLKKVINNIGGQSAYFSIHSTGLHRYLTDFLKLQYRAKARDKKAPEKLFSAPLDIRLAFIDGLFEADGCKKYGTLHMAAYPLLYQVKQLCDISGIYTRLHGPYKDGFSYLLMSKPYNGFTKTKMNVKGLDPNYSYGSFKELKILDKVEETYTLAVHNDEHRFVSDGIVSKNTCGDIIRMDLVNLYEQVFQFDKNNNEIKFVGTVHDEIDLLLHKDTFYKWIPKLRDILQIKFPERDLTLRVEFEVGINFGYTFVFEPDEAGIFHPKLT